MLKIMSYYFHVESQSLPTLREKNEVSAVKWWQLSESQREEYRQEAKLVDMPHASAGSEKKKMRKVLSSLTNMVM